MDKTTIPDGRVDIKHDGEVITVTLIGWITEALTESLQVELERELLSAPTPCRILYDGLYMNDPSLTLVLLMESFYERLAECIAKSAIVVPGYRLAFLSRLAFGKHENKYKVFYNDRGEALACLLS